MESSARVSWSIPSGSLRPLSGDASAVAETIGYAVDQPEGVDVNEVIVRSTASLHG
ncbi:hypothetical protein [Streptomyces sp. NPDC101165]|uniref:hypothetical protein n=1 Tax=Streptomyces sp. NPDC101165 TaxID=3366119 RepID=UPI0037F3EF78